MAMANGSSSSLSASWSSAELFKAQGQVWNCALNCVNSLSLKCAVELGIPDIIHSHGQPMTLSQICSALNIQPNKTQAMERVMRILVHSGFFSLSRDDDPQGYYGLTPASRLLLKDEPFGAAKFLLFMTHPHMTDSLNSLSSWFQNDVPTSFETTHGKGYWEFVAGEDKFSKIFYDCMEADSELIVSVLIKDYKEVFEGIGSLVDVGGGTGATALALAKAFPEINFTVFDQPHVVHNLQGTQNLRFQGGDMFDAIPPADAFLLKWTSHDWGDEDCVKILKKCKEAIPSKGKVIIIEIAIKENSKEEAEEEKEKDDCSSKTETETQLCFDMMCMQAYNFGKQRTVREWEKVLEGAGFSHYKITPCLGARSLIEAYP
uniref:3,5-dimethoxyphenol O-methyltransferase n=1 Tax=Ruta graveolens TaxID=37565 RepID=Q3ZES7_RUTGR|nr:3,5-dimethoxyphenol O-methyltransferase [Ruta graveolens]